ncbi:N-acetylmuramoyl-L-alanine amidase family protein [Amphibacillus sediminis]|uniref:N-acetylmuramoyl-L-alanine amidase family protein n=1 Tax=Amphibacillus sediminis TaxID=360185 RepID=UPI00082D9B30|nr:N-acetylmuramoyl-L-alanine amidase [Amphibacillus sediminis]
MKTKLILICCLTAFLVLLVLQVNQKAKCDKTDSSTQQLINRLSNKQRQNDQLEEFKVVIDPGHGGEDPGAIGYSGSYEKDFTLSLAKKVAHLLEQEELIGVYLTRADDIFLSTETRERPKFANDLDADLFVSIHGNTFDDPTVTGTETYYYHDHSESLANILHRHVLEATGFNDRGVRNENYFVLTDTFMPAVLLEIGYLTNQQEEEKMLTEVFQDRLATSIAEGIKEYLEVD